MLATYYKIYIFTSLIYQKVIWKLQSITSMGRSAINLFQQVFKEDLTCDTEDSNINET